MQKGKIVTVFYMSGRKSSNQITSKFKRQDPFLERKKAKSVPVFEGQKMATLIYIYIYIFVFKGVCIHMVACAISIQILPRRICFRIDSPPRRLYSKTKY